jgi:hypothetical protein
VNELDEIQAFMTAALQWRKALPNDRELATRAAACIAGNDVLSPVEQLEIYREQFWLRHTGSLVEDFPGVSGILGQDAWQRLSEEYLAAYPPASFTLRDLGARFPEFVERSSWLDHHALCVDMAHLELAYLEIFDAADAPPLDPHKLASMPENAWEHAEIVVNPALRLLAVRYPVPRLRRLLREAEVTLESVPIPEPEAAHLVLYRTDRQLFHDRLSAGASALLHALQERVPLLPACERAQLEVPEEAEAIARDVGQWFQEWGARGFVIDVRPAAQRHASE